MKTIILLLLAINISLFAQNLEPTQSKFYIEGDSVLINSDLPLFKQNRMLLGWHWGGGKKMTEALKMSQIHGNTAEPSGRFWSGISRKM